MPQQKVKSLATQCPVNNTIVLYNVHYTNTSVSWHCATWEMANILSGDIIDVDIDEPVNYRKHQ